MTDETIEKKLCESAIEAAKGAYAVYSRCFVGAALLTASGKIYTGCNIENASFTPTVCAERVAFFKAISEGERDFRAIAVAGGREGNFRGKFTPCGVCRQVMAEFCGADFSVLVVRNIVRDGGYDRYTLGELLPHSFDKSGMEE